MMTSIRINNNVYQALRLLQRPRESYGNVIERIILSCPPDMLKRDEYGGPEFTFLMDVLAGAGARKGKNA